RLVVVRARRLEDRQVGVALAEHAGRDGDAGLPAADDEDLVFGGCHGGPLWVSRLGARDGFLPAGVAPLWCRTPRMAPDDKSWVSSLPGYPDVRTFKVP